MLLSYPKIFSFSSHLVLRLIISSVSKTVDIPTFRCYNNIDYSYIKNNNKYIF